MIRAGRIPALLVICAVTAACGTVAGAAGRDEREVLDSLAATDGAPRSFTYAEGPACTPRAAPGDEPCAGWHPDLQVRGVVQDHLRYAATVELGDSPVLEQRVVDDAVAIRVLDAGRIHPELLVDDDPPALSSLRAGGWVIDYEGAPPLAPPLTRDATIEVGVHPVLDAAYVLHYVRRAIGEAALVRAFDPDALAYNPIDDPFTEPPEGLGVRRYDLVAPGLPGRAERGTQEALPGTVHFRQMALYVRDGRLLRIEENIEFEHHRDFRRALEGRGLQHHLQLLESVRQGRTRDTVRTRRMIYEATRVGEAVEVSLPVQDAVAGHLGEAAGPRGTRTAVQHGSE